MDSDRKRLHDLFVTLNKLSEELAAYHVAGMTDAEVAGELERRDELK